MPTFDWSNILKKLVFLPSTGLVTFLNPVRLFLAFAIALGTLAGVVSSFFIDLDFPFLSPPDVAFSINHSADDLKSVVFYITAADHLSFLLDFLLNFFASLIPFTITFFSSYFALAFTYRLSSAFKSWILSMSGNTQ